MGGTSQTFPTKFPCWCKAVYSWGGETKKDLGFIEGDLIECLNAGDGSWWMGRLRRDRRMVGLFPSNFVQVLDQDFQPAPISRNMTPTKSGNQASPSPQKQKSVFRKPFQGYKEFGYRDDGFNSQPGIADKDRPQKKKFSPYSSMKTASAPGQAPKPNAPSPLKEEAPRIPSPPPRRGHRSHSRAPSPSPMMMNSAPSNTIRSHSPAPSAMYRASSPAPPSAHYRAPSPSMQSSYRPHSAVPSMYRPHSPAPSHYREIASRPYTAHASASPTPQPMYQPSSSVPYQPQYYSRSPSPAPPMDYGMGSRAVSPAPPAEWQQHSRSPSPAPFPMYENPSRAPSPAPFNASGNVASSSPPPPPPPHRVAYQPNVAPSSSLLPPDQMEDDDVSAGYNTPSRQSTNGQSSGMTPSPLRDAMNDIMTSLNDMSSVCSPSSPPPLSNSVPPTSHHHPRPDSPSNIWSPESFGQSHGRRTQPVRAQSAMAMHTRQDSYERGGYEEEAVPASRDGVATVGNYVQRMENHLRHNPTSSAGFSSSYQDYNDRPTSRGSQSGSRPTTASSSSSQGYKAISPRKSAYELGRQPLSRTMTTKTSVTTSSSGWRSNATSSTNQSNSTQMTDHTLMSGYSAGGFSATSAGSLARRKFGMGSMKQKRPLSAISSKSIGDIRGAFQQDAHIEKENTRPMSPVSGISYHSSHATQPAQTPMADWISDPMENAGVLGGLAAPKAKKSGFFKRMVETAKTTAKTGAANARAMHSSGRPSSRVGSPKKMGTMPDGVTAIAGGTAAPLSPDMGAHRDMGLGGGNDWMQVRRDVNRSNSLSKNEKNERAERCEMLDMFVVNPIDELMEHAEGDEGLDGLAITDPTDFNTSNLALVDKGTRFVAGLPQMVTPTTLAQSYLCRPYRSDVQRLRAIFTWVGERIAWEEDFEGQIDTRRVLSSKRGCSEEIAALVRDLCAAVGLHAEVVRGYLKGPGESLDLDTIARPNHYWNAVIVDGEWRIIDCALAGPTHPRRSQYSSTNPNMADSWYFLARPMEICFTHVPLLPEQQHIVPPVPHEILMALPCAAAPYFRHHVELVNFDTSVLHLENLEMAHLQLAVPEDVECVAEVEARAFASDWDGDTFETGDIVKKSALAQVEWVGGRKHFMIKALLPGDEGQGVLKIYVGKRGLMHSNKDNPHPLALAVPLFHTGQNPPYAFLTRHPTPHAQRHDLYVAQPQCARLVINNTFVFCVRQHPSSLSRFSPDTWGSSAATPSGNNGRSSAMSMRATSPTPYNRPGSAMSMVSAAASVSHSGSNYSDGSMTDKQQKPAKLAMQSPSGKIIRLTRKQEYAERRRDIDDLDAESLGSTWETVIKVGERGTWRGLVLADRSARWCVFAEWECV
ncbi:hypothetical protein AAFC00_006290 [Neodothiora populina]|uniref:SH3 domain-containing protein n=1 Tax=Neodothiora populina TaxID=2781224 RepID=A0ABR3P4N8_9PEZI